MAVVFGPTADVFFLSYGRRYVAQHMPQSFTDKVKTGELAPMATSWISMDPSCQLWIAKNFVSDKIYFSNHLPPNVLAHLTGTPTSPKSNYIAFSAEPNGYFAKHVVGHGWSTDLLPAYETSILATREQVGERAFDTALRRVLFGRNGTHVMVFETGFIAKLEGPCTKLNEALGEFNGPGWSLDEGSALSMHNEDHYFLKFSKKGVQGVQIRAHMPPFMEAKFVELMKEAKHPEEESELIKEQHMIQQILAQRSAQETQMNYMPSDSHHQDGMGTMNTAPNATRWEYR